MDNGFWQKVRRTMSVHSKRIHFESFLNPATADADAFMTGTALVSAATVQTFTVANFDGVGHTAGALTYPRNITFVFDASTDWDATTVVVTGTDVNGAAISENFSAATSASLTGAKAFKSVTSVYVPAQTGAGGTATMGFGALLGLSKKVNVRDGHAMVIVERVDGTQATNGVWAVPATGLPNGTYAPNSAPNAARDYLIGYELDVTVA